MPVTTMSLSRGISTSTFCRLFSRAPRIWIVVRMLDVEQIGGLFNPQLAAFRQLERRGYFFQQPFSLQPLARRFQMPGVQLRERKVIAYLRQRNYAVLLLEVVEQWFQVSL